MTEPNPGSRGRGRPPGSRNKVTASVKAALEDAFEGIGGVENLMEWARANPGEFFKLWAKLLPVDLRAELNHSGSITIVVETGVPRAPDSPMVGPA